MLSRNPIVIGLSNFITVGSECFVTAKQALLRQRQALACSIRQSVMLLMEHTTDKQAPPEKAVDQAYELERRGLIKVFAVALNPSVSMALDRKIQVHEIKNLCKRPRILVTLRVHLLRLFQDSKEWEQIKKKPGLVSSQKSATTWPKAMAGKLSRGMKRRS